jgi:hypothetical protein
MVSNQLIVDKIKRECQYHIFSDIVLILYLPFFENAFPHGYSLDGNGTSLVGYWDLDHITGGARHFKTAVKKRIKTG